MYVCLAKHRRALTRARTHATYIYEIRNLKMTNELTISFLKKKKENTSSHYCVCIFKCVKARGYSWRPWRFTHELHNSSFCVWNAGLLNINEISFLLTRSLYKTRLQRWSKIQFQDIPDTQSKTLKMQKKK